MAKMFQTSILLVVILCISACSGLRKDNMDTIAANEIKFNYFEKDYLVVRVKINETVEGNFIVDTGIGITLISKSLCKQIGCIVNGEHVGKRMSGQEVKVPLSLVKSIELAGKKELNAPVGIFDVESLMPGSNINGFLSLGFFRNIPHTVLYNKNVIRFEDEASLKNLRTKGSVVNVIPDQQGVSFGILMPLAIPNNQVIKAEVDTGSQSLILHERYMKSLQIESTDAAVKRREGKDETGHSYVRYFTSLNGAVHLVGAEHMKINSPQVMFQKIIYDGLVGFYFLREFDVTYDLPNSQMIFNKPAD